MSEDRWTKDRPEPGDLDKDLGAIDPQCLERHAGDREARLRLVRTTGERVVDEHADALKLLADHDPGEDV